MSHGTFSTYTNEGCRCDECKAGRAAFERERYHRRRAAAIEQLGGRCAECRATGRLDFDHIDPDQKEMKFCKAFGTPSEERLQAELAKAQLLCRSCHQRKTWRERRAA